MTARTSRTSSARPQFSACAGKTDSYDLWTCRETVWNKSFRGKNVDGTDFPNDRFSATFFQPFYAGQTFGLGQLNPLTALQMSDLVHQVSGLPRLDAGDPNQVYETIMDPDLTLPYVAATLKIDRCLQHDRRLRHFAEPRHHRDALQCRQSRGARLCAEGRERGARRKGRGTALAGGKLLRLAGQRKAAGTSGALLSRNLAAQI